MLPSILWSCGWFVSQNLPEWCGGAKCSCWELGYCVCTEEGDAVCSVLLNTAETPAGDTGVTVTDMEGAERQMTNSRGSSGCEGFTNIFGFFSCSVLTSDPFGSLHFLGSQDTPNCPVPSARLLPVPLGSHHGAASPQPEQLRLFWACDSTCICCGTTGSL